MEYKIICEACSEIIGTLRKDEISEEDKSSYKSATTCSNGHIEKVILVAEPSTPDQLL